MNIKGSLKKKTWWLIIVVLLLLSSCSEPASTNVITPPSPLPSPTIIPTRELSSDEEYRIYDAYLTSRYASTPGTQTVIIVNESYLYSLPGKNEIDFAKEKLPTSGDEVWINFLERNNQVYEHENQFSPKEIGVVFVSREYVEGFFNGDLDLDLEWRNFDNAHPDSYGYLTLSKVGVNAQIDKAIIYVEWHCGSTCGAGSFVFLKKVFDSWQFVKSALLWNA